MELKYITTNQDSFCSINEILKNKLNISSRLLHTLIIKQKVMLNGKLCDTRHTLSLNDIITVDLGSIESNSNIIPNKIKLDIIYEDDWLLAVNKPAGIATHPSMRHYETSLSNGVRYYFDTINLKKKIRPINRLDINTSGLVLFAKCEYIQDQFTKQRLDNTLKKQYLCIVEGFIEPSQGIINLPIGRKENSIIERCISYNNGQPAMTNYKVLKNFSDYCLVNCCLETGRTHQIRVHMNAIGHSLIGDTLYGKPSSLISRQALHSYTITFMHPVTRMVITLMAPLPDDMNNLLV